MAGGFCSSWRAFYLVRMAKQIGLLRLSGTVSGICFYKMDGVYYAREKSKLSGERVKHDPVFAETMRYADLMAKASVIASELYKQVPKEERSRERYRELVGAVIKGLQMALRLPPNTGQVRSGFATNYPNLHE